MTPALDDAPLFEDQDVVGHADRGKSVGDQEDHLLRRALAHTLEDLRFGPGIDRGRRLVEHQLRARGQHVASQRGDYHERKGSRRVGKETLGMASLPQSHLTAEEYLARERVAERKSEYIDGVVVAMAGASERHNLIVANVIMTIGPALRGGPCRVYPSDLKVRVGSRFFYPDVSVICGDTIFADDEKDVVLNPTLIVEVLSETTRDYDRGPKFFSYQQIPSLQDYLLVHQDEVMVEHYRRHPPNAWLYTQTVGLGSTLELPSLGYRMALTDIYPAGQSL